MQIFVSALSHFLLFSFIIKLNVIVVVVVAAAANNEIWNWKMKVCLNGSSYETTGEQCRFGVWFTEPKKIQRICFENGMWALYKEWCDSDPILWTTHPGRKGCVSENYLKEDIAGIVPLGKSGTGAALSTLRRRLFFGIDMKERNKWDFLDSSVEILTWGRTPYSLLEIVDHRRNQKCLIKGKFAFFSLYKFELETNNKVELIMKEDKCLEKPADVATRSQVLPTEIQFSIFQSQSESMEFKCDEKNVDANANCDINEYGDDKRPKKEIEKIVNEQSLRISLKFYAIHFNREKVPDMEFEEWEFLETAKYIFQNFLILESFDMFPPTEDEDHSARLRIRTALSACSNNSKPFEYDYKETCYKGAPLLKGNNSQGKTVLKLIEIPPFNQIDVEKYDLILEAAWKLMVFSHYYCADNFKTYPSDLSLLQNRWQSLIAPDLLRRWKNPGRSYIMMEKLFMSIDITSAIKNVDYCVGAAHLDSAYQGWIKRPLSKKSNGKPTGDKKENRIWDGNAYCNNDDYLYPATNLQYPIEKCGIKFAAN